MQIPYEGTHLKLRIYVYSSIFYLIILRVSLRTIDCIISTPFSVRLREKEKEKNFNTNTCTNNYFFFGSF